MHRFGNMTPADQIRLHRPLLSWREMEDQGEHDGLQEPCEPPMCRDIRWPLPRFLPSPHCHLAPSASAGHLCGRLLTGQPAASGAGSGWSKVRPAGIGGNLIAPEQLSESGWTPVVPSKRIQCPKGSSGRARHCFSRQCPECPKLYASLRMHKALLDSMCPAW